MRRILVVDDEPDVRRALARAIRFADFLPSEAGSADEAIRLCDEHSFDVVILDFIMPDMNGIELLARLRRRQPFIRSILVSGKLDPTRAANEIAAEVREAVEADVYFHKPVANRSLIEAVQSLIAGEATQDWQSVANRIATAGRGTLKAAKSAAKDLKRHRSQPARKK